MRGYRPDRYRGNPAGTGVSLLALTRNHHIFPNLHAIWQ